MGAVDVKRLRVLRVDDHALFRDGLRAPLQRAPSLEIVAGRPFSGPRESGPIWSGRRRDEQPS